MKTNKNYDFAGEWFALCPLPNGSVGYVMNKSHSYYTGSLWVKCQVRSWDHAVLLLVKIKVPEIEHNISRNWMEFHFILENASYVPSFSFFRVLLRRLRYTIAPEYQI